MTKAQAYLSQPIIQRLPNLLREVQAGEIRVPRFQRPFVWTTDQRLDLFRSIYEGIPIGSFLIWRTRDHDLQCYDRLGTVQVFWPHQLDVEGSGAVRQYLLDGNQRLTTLYGALGEGLISSETIAEEEAASVRDDTEEAQIEPIFFDLEERAFFERRPRYGQPPVKWLPLSILLDPSRLYDFQKKLLEAGIDRALVNRAESLASTFKDYSIPVVPIVTEDLELATQSFLRVNSGGTKMNQVHMVSALTWSRGFDLNERVKEVLSDLGEVGWQDLDEQMILNVCKAALDLDIYYADAEEIRKAIKNHPQVLQEATESLKAAAGFLREKCNVYGPAVLPYSFQVVLLADAIQRAGGGEKLSSEAGSAIEKWFWLTTYTEHFAGISAGRLDQTLKHLRQVAAAGEFPNPPGMPREVSTPRRFDFRAARSRAIALRLAHLNPQSPQGGHEFFDPFQLLADFGRDAMPMLIPSQKLGRGQAEGPENRILVHPKEASALRRTLKGSPVNTSRLASLFFEMASAPRRTPFAALLEMHAISEPALRAFRAGDFAEFLRLRRQTIVALERAFVENLGLELTGE